MKKAVYGLTALLLTGCSTIPATTPKSEYYQHYKISDKISGLEPESIKTIYNEANTLFSNGEYHQAINHYEYIAYKDSLAASLRLCVIHAYGIGTEVDALKSLFWCNKIQQAGYKPAGKIITYLSANYWPEYHE